VGVIPGAAPSALLDLLLETTSRTQDFQYLDFKTYWPNCIARCYGKVIWHAEGVLHRGHGSNNIEICLIDEKILHPQTETGSKDGGKHGALKLV
jgi:hypothetical protein